MNKYLFSFLFSLTLSQIAVDETPDNFLVITDDNLEEITAQNNPKIIFYFSQKDCNNCPKIRNNLSNLIQQNRNLGIATFILDCDRHPQSCRKRLNNRKPPAVLIQISTKYIFYYGDYSVKSIKEFIEKRFVSSTLRTFNREDFKSETEKSKKVQHAILVYRGQDPAFKEERLRPLAQFEPEDAYFLCQNRNNCDFLFDKATDDICFLKADRRYFANSQQFKTFEDLQSHFYNFKNVFLIPFGIEFEKKVFEEMNPTIILIVSGEEDTDQAEIETFKSLIAKYSKRCFASIIQSSSLSKQQLRIFNAFKAELGVEIIPKLVIIEADMETLKMQKYFYPSSEIVEEEVSSFIENWFNRKLEPSKRSERIKEGLKREGFEVLSHETFKSKVFLKKQESVVLVYQHINESNSSLKFWNLLKKVSSDPQFSNLRYFVIDGLKNDLPVFITKIPTFLIFSKDSWENPLVFDRDDEKTFRDVLLKRKDLVFDVLGAEPAGGDLFENKKEETPSFDSEEEDEL